MSLPLVTFSWSSPQFVFSTAGGAVTSGSLDIASDETPAGALYVMLSAQAGARPSLCFSSPSAPATLTLQYGSRRFTRSFTGNNPAGMCGGGLAVLIGSQRTGTSPGLEFGGIDSLALRARAPEATMQSFVGSIGLAPGGTTLIGTPSVVTLSASEKNPIATLLDVEARTRSLALISPAATSIMTSSGELVPSELERLQGIISFLSPFLSALLAALLAVGVAALLEPLRQWRQGRDGS
jgi:hypothetical protein